MSPIGLLCALVFNGVLVTVAILVCFVPASGGREAVMPAALASLFATFFLERLVPNVDPRLLSLRTFAFAVAYPLTVSVLTALVMLIGSFARPGGSINFIALLLALFVVPVIVGVSTLGQCWMTALIGGSAAAGAMVIFKRLLPVAPQAGIPAPPQE